jgi:hypothetical protein
MTVLPFPARGPFTVRVCREESAWLVVCRDHGWLHADSTSALTEARQIAAGFGVAVEVSS